jgi:hypothetical protein
MACPDGANKKQIKLDFIGKICYNKHNRKYEKPSFQPFVFLKNAFFFLFLKDLRPFFLKNEPGKVRLIKG